MKKYVVVFSLLGLFLCPSAVSAQTVDATSPGLNEVGVSPSASISITFAEEMEPETFNAVTFIVTGHTMGPIAASTIFYEEETATFIPADDFAPGEVVTVTLTDSV